MMSSELSVLESRYAEVRAMQSQVKSQYEALLAFFGENLNSTPSGGWLEWVAEWMCGWMAGWGSLDRQGESLLFLNVKHT